MKTWNIVWHDRDLRLEDNPALTEAAAENALPIFIHCPEEEKPWSRGAASNWWLHHSLESLKEEYTKRGTDLIIRSGPAPLVFKQLLSELSIKGVYWNRRYEPALRSRDEKVAHLLKTHNIPTFQFEGNYLTTPSDILNKSGTPYAVYTPFSKTLMEMEGWRAPLTAPHTLTSSCLSSESVASLHLLPKLNWSDPFQQEWTPGRQGAVKQLEIFKSKISAYKMERDLPSHHGTSKLSPHLHFGEISPHEIWRAVKDSNQDPVPFLRQLIWREFSNYLLFHSPFISDHPWKVKFEQFPWEKNPQALHAWQKGITGYPIVDAGMRELWRTGWMHNRVRMIVASFLVKDLFIHWSEGARWFWDTLVDADLANNSLGWQWVAGSGPDAAPYFRIFNPVLQGKKFDPEGDYIRKWIPELKHLPSTSIHSPWEVPLLKGGYPDPIVDHARARQKALDAYQRIK